MFLFICLIALVTLLLACSNEKESQSASRQHNKFGNIDKNDITSFKVTNIGSEEKEIRNKSDRDKIIDLVNGVNITKVGVQLPTGVGVGVIITYSNGEKFSASFLAATMSYSTDNNGVCCNIDKNIVDDLRNYYDKN